MKNDEIQIVEMTPQNISTVKKIEAESGLSSWSEKDYLSQLKRTDSHTKVIKFKNQIVGFILARLITKQIDKNYNTSEIFNIAVKKQFRKKQFGSSLLKGLIEICKKNDISEIWLEVRKSNNAAQGFYSKHGFEKVGERQKYYTKPTEDGLIMKRDLQKYINK